MAIYAFSDAHGCWEPFQQLLEFIKPEDRVICLGDCGDRGEDGWKIIETVLNDKRFIYLKGNHEDMLIKTIQAYRRFMISYQGVVNEDEINFYLSMDSDYELLYINGGCKTFKDWREAKERMVKYHLLNNLAYRAEYINKKGQKVILTHAGYTPKLNYTPDNDDLLWNRSHFMQTWDNNFPDVVIVHGHTPLMYMDEYLWEDCRDNDPNDVPGAYWYCNGHKVNIDRCTIITGELVLLNLDTWEEHIFKDDKIYCG
ncbi:MAG: metallophosphoesterase [Bacillota bacterium]|nr:metallophosphoesterase [Bacillota bacterium]